MIYNIYKDCGIETPNQTYTTTINKVSSKQYAFVKVSSPYKTTPASPESTCTQVTGIESDYLMNQYHNAVKSCDNFSDCHGFVAPAPQTVTFKTPQQRTESGLGGFAFAN